jgi:hypothetical protein
VILVIGDDTIQTTYKKNDLNPVWNESFIFEIDHSQHQLLIQVMDKDTFGQDFEGKAEVNLREDQEIADQKKTIVWRELTDENGNGGRGQIKLQIHWIYSRFRYFDGLAQTWGEALHADKEELERTEGDLAQMEKPFGFLSTLKSLAIYDAEDDKSDEEENDPEKAAAAQLAKDTFKSDSMKQREAAIVGTFENVTDGVARSIGLDGCPWYLLTIIVLWLYIIVTALACYYRADFLNATICVVAFYMVSEPQSVKKWTFRLLVLGVLMSLVFDFAFFMLNDFDLKKVQGGDTSLTITVGYYATVFGFFFKFFVALVFWKDSTDFNRIIKKQQNSVPNRFSQPGGSPTKDTNMHRRGAQVALSEFQRQAEYAERPGI